MMKYEILIVFNPELSENALKEEMRKVDLIMRQNGAREVKVDNWGKRETCYRMKGYNLGNYVCMSFEAADGALLDALTAGLRIMDNVLKFQTHKIYSSSRKFKGRIRPKQSVAVDAIDEDLDLVEAELV